MAGASIQVNNFLTSITILVLRSSLLRFTSSHAVAEGSKNVRFRCSQGHKISLAVSNSSTYLTILPGKTVKHVFKDRHTIWSVLNYKITGINHMQVFVHLFLMYLLHSLQVWILLQHYNLYEKPTFGHDTISYVYLLNVDSICRLKQTIFPLEKSQSPWDLVTLTYRDLVVACSMPEATSAEMTIHRTRRLYEGIYSCFYLHSLSRMRACEMSIIYILSKLTGSIVITYESLLLFILQTLLLLCRCEDFPTYIYTWRLVILSLYPQFFACLSRNICDLVEWSCECELHMYIHHC